MYTVGIRSLLITAVVCHVDYLSCCIAAYTGFFACKRAGGEEGGYEENEMKAIHVRMKKMNVGSG
jgi:hypothetical protein